MLSAGMAPYGDPPGGLRTRPLAFLRRLFCLTRKLGARSRCPDKARFDLVSTQPDYPRGRTSETAAVHRDDAATADFSKIPESRAGRGARAYA